MRGGPTLTSLVAALSLCASPTLTGHGDAGRAVRSLSPSAPVLLPATDPHHVTYSPMDPNVAAGPTRLMEVVNSKYAVFDKRTHKELRHGSLASLWGLDPSSFIVDPRVVYDVLSKRFIVSADFVDEAARISKILLAVSRTSKPERFRSYSTPSSYTVRLRDRAVAYYSDHPHLGVDRSGIYVTADSAPFGGEMSANRSRLYVWSKRAVVAGTAPAHRATRTFDEPELNVQPALTLDRSTKVEWMVTSYSGGSPRRPNRWLDLLAVTGAGGRPSEIKTSFVHTVRVPGYWAENGGAPQKGSNAEIDIAESSLLIDSAVVRGGRLYTTMSSAASDPHRGSAVQYYDVNLRTHKLAGHKQWSAAHDWYFDPAVSPDVKDGHVMITFQYSGPSHYLAAYYATYIPTRGWRRLTRFGSAEVGVTYGRSGDYAGASPDPGGGKIWVVNAVGEGGCAGAPRCISRWKTAIVSR